MMNIYFKQIIVLFVFLLTVSGVQAQVSVTATAGTAGPTSYTTLNAAFAAINAGTHQGSIQIAVTGNTTEPAVSVPLLKSASPSSYTDITIKPSGGDFAINSNATPTASRGVIELFGADNVTIDGDDPLTAGTRNLSFVVAVNTLTGTAAIRLASTSTTGADGADNNTIKNCIITGGRNFATNPTTTNYGVVFSNSSSITTGAYSSINTIIDNNLITRAFQAVYAAGSSTTYPNTGTIIKNNVMGSAVSANNIGSRGVFISYSATTTGGAVIDNNDIRVGDYGTSGYSATIAGIEMGTANYGLSITKNYIHDIVQPTSGGYGAHGIYVTGSTNNTSSTIANNIIRDVKMVAYQTSATSTFIPCGLFFTAGATGVKFNHNTIQLNQQLSANATYSSYCVDASASGVVFTEFQNNILVNNHNSTNALAVYTAATGNISSAIMNNNNYYTIGGNLGYYNAALRTNLSAWQTATSKDANTKNILPGFKSATDLHIDTTNNVNVALFQTGVAVPAITTDIDGQTRNNPPCIGADEFFIPTCSGAPTAGTITGPGTICTGTGTTLSVSGSSSGIGIKYQWMSSTVAGGPYSYGVADTSATLATGNLTVTTYYRRKITCTTSALEDSTAEYTININSTIPTVTISPSSAQYCGYDSVVLTASGATTYIWSPATDLTATTGAVVKCAPTATRTYTVIGTDNACTASATVNVTIGKKVTISSVSAKSPSACAGNTDSITVVASMPMTPSSFTFVGSTGAYTPITGTTLGATAIGDDVGIGNLPIGFTFNYNGVAQTVFGARSNGLIVLGETTLAPTGLSANSLSGNANCIAPFWDDNNTTGGSIIYSTTGVAPNRVLTVQWTGMHVAGAGSSTNPTLDMQLLLYEGTNIIQFIYGPTSAALSSPTASIGISGTVGNYLSVTPLLPSNTSTASSAAEFSVTSGTNVPSGTVYTFSPPSGLTYNWSSLNPLNTVTDNTLKTAVATVNANGKYQIIVTEPGGCSALDSSLQIILGGGTISDTISATPATTVCAGTTVTLSNTGLNGGCGPFTFSWSSGASTSTIAVSPLATTSYTVTVKDNNLDSAVATYTVNVFTASTPVITPTSPAVCGSTPATLTATLSGASAYKWSVTGAPTSVTGLYTDLAATTAATTTTNNTSVIYAKPTGSTSYTVTVTDANSCSVTASKTVNVYSGVTGVTANASLSAVCLGSTVDLTSTGTSTDYLTTLLSEGFETATFPPIGWSNINAGTGPNTWSSSATFNTGAKSMAYLYNSANAANAWMISPVLAMNAGQQYQISFWYKVNSSSFPEKLKVTIGTASTVVAQTNVLWDNNGGTQLTNTTWAKGTITYTPTVTGNYYLGFNCYSDLDEWNLYVDDIAVNTDPMSVSFAWSSSPSGFTSSVQNPTAVAPTATTTYTVTASTPVCSATASTTVGISTFPVSVSSITASNSTICTGDSSVLTVTAVNGCQPYTYLWSSGETVKTISKKPTSTTVYHVTVTDNNSVTVTDSITVNVNNPQPAATSGAARCGSGTLTLSATQTSPSDSINWYTALVGGTKVGSGTSFTTPSISTTTTYYAEAEQASGSFIVGPVSPTAQGGTQGTQTVQWDVYYTVNTSTVLTSVDIFPIASGEAGAIQVKTSGGVVLATFPFTTNVSGGNTAQTIALNYSLPAGSYSLYPSTMPTSGLSRNISGAVYPYAGIGASITSNGYDQTYYMCFYKFVFGATCKGVRVPVVATINAIPTVNLGNDTAVCSPNTVVLDAQNTGSSYLWSNSSTTQTLTASTSGTYSVVVTDANSCTASDAIVVTVNALPVVNLGADTARCGGSVTLNAGNTGSTYLWTDASTAQTLTASSTGTYGVLVTDANGCKSADTVSVTIHTIPTVNLGNDTAVCSPNTVVLDAQNTGSSYLWSNSSATQTLTASTSGTYSVVVTDANSCTASDAIVVTVNALPVVNLGADTARCGGSVTLNAGNTGSTYLWSNSATTQTTVISATNTVSVLVTNAAGCKNRDTVKVTINIVPTVSFSLTSDTTCLNGASIALTATPTGGTFTGTGVSGTIFNPSVAGTGTHTITYTFTDAITTCSASASDVVFVKSTCTGIEDIEKIAIALYPSPTSGTINIVGVVTNNENVSAVVYDALGKVVLTNTINSTNRHYQMDVKDLASGVYTVSIVTENGNYIGRFIRE